MLPVPGPEAMNVAIWKTESLRGGARNWHKKLRLEKPQILFLNVREPLSTIHGFGKSVLMNDVFLMVAHHKFLLVGSHDEETVTSKTCSFVLDSK
jgi:hypothetical protein